MTTFSELTTIRVGGEAQKFVRATTETELIAATYDAWNSADPWFVLGGGSNIVMCDDGFPGTVIHVTTQGIERVPTNTPGKVRLRVQAGEPWDDVVSYTVTNGYAGIEALSGIPGSTGAAPVQNIGAYGQELSSTLVAIHFLEVPGVDDTHTPTVVRIPASELQLGYRTSALKQGRHGVVTAVELELTDTQTDGLGTPLEYDQLAKALKAQKGDRFPLAEVRRTVRELRASKGMLCDPNDHDTWSCGSFFTNPIVSENFARGLPASLPRWPVNSPPSDSDEQKPFHVKISAAWLIEQAGIRRGFALPGSDAAISSKHTLAITNRGNATAGDIAELARYIVTRVESEFGVILQPEPLLVGTSL